MAMGSSRRSLGLILAGVVACALAGALLARAAAANTTHPCPCR